MSFKFLFKILYFFFYSLHLFRVPYVEECYENKCHWRY